jgi:F-box/leucine-rich repeat protein 7
MMTSTEQSIVVISEEDKLVMEGTVVMFYYYSSLAMVLQFKLIVCIDLFLYQADDDNQNVPQGHSCVDTSTICSTSSDPDPTLSSAVSKIRESGTRKRRASVAVWSDPDLLAFAERKSAEQLESQDNEASRFAEPVYSDTEVEVEAFTVPDAVSTASLMTLKDGILVEILKHVDFATLMVFRGVSKKADVLLRKQVANTLFKDVNLSHWNKKMTDDTFIPIAKFLGTKVKSLDLTNCFHLTFKSFQTISNYNSKIIRLNLHSCWELLDSSLTLLASGCPYLTDIELSNCRKITDRGIFSLFSTVRQTGLDDMEMASNLSEMSVDGHSTSSTPSTASAGITHIGLSYCKNLTDASMRHIAEYGADTLVHINFQRCTTITDAGFEAWQPGTFKCLQSVILTDCTFLTDRAIASLARAASNIRYISLSFCCALTDNAIEILARQLRLLEHIDASYCGAAVSDASVQALVQEGSRNLKEINVRGCVRLTDTAVHALLAIARLHLLNISQCQSVTGETKTMLQRYHGGEDCPEVVV